ncbi:MAG: four helix bundle protein, partial [Desulfuromonadales bacterium]|nr:four helix bundle protein [Desulfuromonadales bacterium]
MKKGYENHGKNGNDENQGKAAEPSHDSQNSHNSQSLLLTPRGDYQTLLSYQKTEVVYQLTYRFCQRFLRRGDR